MMFESNPSTIGGTLQVSVACLNLKWLLWCLELPFVQFREDLSPVQVKPHNYHSGGKHVRVMEQGYLTF